MAVAFGTASSAVSSTTPYNVPLPSGAVSGEVLVAFQVQDVNTPTSLGLTGGATWNVLTSGTVTSSTRNVKVYWKVAGGSEPANYSAAQNSGSDGHTSIIRVTGGSSAAPLFATNLTGQTGTSISTPSVTPAGAADLCIRFVGGLRNGGGTITWTAPAGHTERTDQQSGSLTTGSSATQVLSSGSATGTASFTASASMVDALGVTVTVTGGNSTIDVGGIASAEAFGTASIVSVIGPTGIASGEAFGSAIVTTPSPQTISPTGLLSGEAWGTLTTGLFLKPGGIATAEAWGAARLAALIGPTGIPSAEAWGLTNVAIQQFIRPSGLVSAEAFGTHRLQLGYPQTISVEGIESGEMFEDPTVRNDHRLVLVNPSIQETPAAWDRLNVRFGIHRGITIMKDAIGVWSTVRYPSQVETESAQRVYMGGHRHTISLGEAEELISAGYGAYILLEPDI